jgi:hypothetical protein
MTASSQVKLPIMLFWGYAAVCQTSGGFMVQGIQGKSSQDFCVFVWFYPHADTGHLFGWWFICF